MDLRPEKLPKVYTYCTDTCEKHTLTHTDVTSTMSPGDETLEYECRHENKGTDQLWCLKDEVCGFEAKKATKSVHCTDTCEKHTLTHTDVTSTMSPGDETLNYLLLCREVSNSEDYHKLQDDVNTISNWVDKSRLTLN